jgi:hypothetical protein
VSVNLGNLFHLGLHFSASFLVSSIEDGVLEKAATLVLSAPRRDGFPEK